jgi:hypothetical protein
MATELYGDGCLADSQQEINEADSSLSGYFSASIVFSTAKQMRRSSLWC